MIVCKVTAFSTRRLPEVRGVRTLIASCPGTPSSAPAGVERVSIPSRISEAPRVRATRGKWLEDFPGAIPSRGDYGVQKGDDARCLGEMGSPAKAYAIRGLRECSVGEARRSPIGRKMRAT